MKDTPIRRPITPKPIPGGQLAARVVAALFPAPRQLRPIRQVAASPVRRPAIRR